MYRLGFATDIHLDHLTLKEIKNFCISVNTESLDGILITGDISNGLQLVNHLIYLSENITAKIYFTLGNHDHWRTSQEYLYTQLEKLISRENLVFLDTSQVIELTSKSALIGHTGWYDLENGDYLHSGFFPNGMPEFRFVTDFINLSPSAKKQKCVEWTTKAADYLETRLLEAIAKYDVVYCGTHVPPYLEASRHLGKLSDPDGAPFFSNRIIGERLTNVMSKYKDKNLIILCGHTHSEYLYHPAKNITVYVGNATYGFPAIYKTFSI